MGEPTCRRNELARERKLRMAALGLPSTHWASIGLPHTLVKPTLPSSTALVVTDDAVNLPLRRTLKPVTLLAHVNVLDMWTQLEHADSMKSCLYSMACFPSLDLRDGCNNQFLLVEY